MATPTDKAEGIEELERSECFRLLGTAEVGRLAVNAPDWGSPPLIRPVNYLFDHASNSVIFRSAQGSKFTALLLSGLAAFEVDAIDPDRKSGWSVIALGPVEHVREKAAIWRVEDLRPWAPGEKPYLLRLRVESISGRRVIGGPDALRLTADRRPPRQSHP